MNPPSDPWYIRYGNALLVSAAVALFAFLLVPSLRGIALVYLVVFGIAATAVFTDWLPEVTTKRLRKFLGMGDTVLKWVVPAQPQAPAPQALPASQMQAAMSYTIRVPKGGELQPARAVAFVEAILKTCGEALFAIVFEHDLVEWRVIDTSNSWQKPDTVATAIRRLYPQAEVSAAPYSEPRFSANYERFLIPIVCGGEPFRPLKMPGELKEHDPLSALTNILSLADPDERVILGIYMGREATREIYRSLWKDITVSRAGWGEAPPSFRGSSSDTMGYLMTYAAIRWYRIFQVKRRESHDPTLRAPKYEPVGQKAFEQKLTRPLFHTQMFLQFDCPAGRSIEKFASLLATIQEFGSDYQFVDFLFNEKTSVTLLPPDAPHLAAQTSMFAQVQRIIQERVNRSRYAGGLLPNETLITTAELATIWHLPTKTFESEEIAYAKSVIRMPETLAEAKEAVCFGVNTFAGTERKAYLPYAARDTHLAIVGKTRMGKSTLLHSLIHQDIAAGYGVAVIDPQGQLVREILRYSIPDNRMGDVVLLDLNDETHPLPLNLLAAPSGLTSDVVIAQVYAVLERYGDLGETQTLRPALWHSLSLLRYETTPTIRDVFRVLTDDTYRQKLREQGEQTPVSEDYWASFDRKYPSQRDDKTIAPLTERLSRFYGSNSLYYMTCHPDRLDFQRFMGEGKIILLSLADPESAWPESHKQMLGGTLVSQLLMAAIARGFSGKPFFLYIDEVDAFTTSPLDTILSKAGKYHLSLTIAAQFLAQLRGTTFEAVMGNVTNWAVFRVGQDDARRMTAYLPGFSDEDLTGMAAHHAAALVQKGTDTHAFSLKTLPVPGTSTHKSAVSQEIQEREATIRRLAQQTYLPRTRQEVADWLTARYATPPIAPRPKTRVDADDFLEPDEGANGTPPPRPRRRKKKSD